MKIRRRIGRSRPSFQPPMLLLISLVTTLVVGCDVITQRPLAVGPDAEIAVVTDSATWEGNVGDAVRRSLGPYIETLPAPENMFSLVRRGINERGGFDRIQSLKNVVFVAPLSDSTAEAAFLRSAFSEEALAAIRDGEGGVVGRDDPWRRMQKVYFVAAETPGELASTIEEAGPSMIDAFNEIARRRMTRDMFEKGRQFHLEDSLMGRHGFAVSVQHDYLIAADTMNFVWLRRILSDSWRSLFVHYVERGNPAELSQEWIVAHRDSLARRYVRGNVGGWVETDTRRPLETRQVNLGGRFGYETRGLWQMVGPDDEGNIVQYGMGGPFVNYTFYDSETSRTYMIDGMVFAPNYAKRDFVRQLEVIAYTFRTEADADADTTSGDAIASAVR